MNPGATTTTTDDGWVTIKPKRSKVSEDAKTAHQFEGRLMGLEESHDTMSDYIKELLHRIGELEVKVNGMVA